MYAGVGKSGSPAPKPITGRPSALRALAFASTASVADSAIPPTRSDTRRPVAFPVPAGLSEALVELFGEAGGVMRPCSHPPAPAPTLAQRAEGLLVRLRLAGPRRLHDRWNSPLSGMPGTTGRAIGGH